MPRWPEVCALSRGIDTTSTPRGHQPGVTRATLSSARCDRNLDEEPNASSRRTRVKRSALVTARALGRGRVAAAAPDDLVVWGTSSAGRAPQRRSPPRSVHRWPMRAHSASRHGRHGGPGSHQRGVQYGRHRHAVPMASPARVAGRIAFVEAPRCPSPSEVPPCPRDRLVDQQRGSPAPRSVAA